MDRARRWFVLTLASLVSAFTMPPRKKITECSLAVTEIQGTTAFVALSAHAQPRARLTRWLLLWGDGHEQQGTGSPPSALAHLYTKVQDFTARLWVWDSRGESAMASIPIHIVAMPTPGPITPPQPPQTGAGDIFAASASRNDVQAAIDLAVNGQVVVIPDATVTWTSGVTITGKAITLRAQTQGGVTLVDNLSDGADFVSVTESTQGLTEIKHLIFDSRTKAHSSGGGAQIRITGVTGGRPVLVHHNTFQLGDGWSYSNIDGIHVHVNRGVIYQNTFTATFTANGYLNGLSAIRHKLNEGAPGLAQWESASTLGTLDTTGEMNLYIEQNTMTGLTQGTDFDDSCRVVFRYNTLMDTLVLSHGFDSSPYGSRQVEIYGNVIDYGATTITHPTLGPVPMNVSSMIGMRGGGVWRVYNNQIADPSTPGSLWGSRNALLFEMYTLRGNPYCETGAYPIYHQQARGHNGTAYFQDPTYIWGNTKLTTPWVTTGAGDPLDAPSVHNSDSCRADGLTTANFVVLGRDFFLAAAPSYTAYPYPHPLASEAGSGPLIVGPQQNVTQPAGSVSISAGSTTSSRQALINANPAGTTFYLLAGTHTANGVNTPKSGNTFVGQYGSIIDGSGWVTSNDNDALFTAPSAVDVTFRNLTMRNLPQRGVSAYPWDGATGWTIEYCEIDHVAGEAIIPGNNCTIRHNKLHHCYRAPGHPGGLSGACIFAGGAYPNVVNNVLIQDNEMYEFGPIQKCLDATNVVWRNNHIHTAPTGSAIWNDGVGNGFIAEDNLIEDVNVGVWFELSYGGTIRRNTIRRTTDQAIFLSTSRNTDVYENVIEDCYRAVAVFVNCASIGQFAWDTDTRDNSIHHNTIRVPNTANVLGNFFSYAGACDVSAYLNNSKNNDFDFNAYHVPSLSGFYWLWGGGLLDWTAWRALPQDATGTVSQS